MKDEITELKSAFHEWFEQRTFASDLVEFWAQVCLKSVDELTDDTPLPVQDSIVVSLHKLERLL